MEERGQITPEVVVLQFCLLAFSHVVICGIIEFFFIVLSVSCIGIHADGLVLGILLKCVEHQIVETILSMIKSGQVAESLRVILESFLAQVETNKEARIEEDKDYENVEGKLQFFCQSYFVDLVTDLLRPRRNPTWTIVQCFNVIFGNLFKVSFFLYPFSLFIFRTRVPLLVMLFSLFLLTLISI